MGSQAEADLPTTQRQQQQLSGTEYQCMLPENAQSRQPPRGLWCGQEASFYTSMEKAQQDTFQEYVREGFTANYANILVILLSLHCCWAGLCLHAGSVGIQHLSFS